MKACQASSRLQYQSQLLEASFSSFSTTTTTTPTTTNRLQYQSQFLEAYYYYYYYSSFSTTTTTKTNWHSLQWEKQCPHVESTLHDQGGEGLLQKKSTDLLSAWLNSPQLGSAEMDPRKIASQLSRYESRIFIIFLSKPNNNILEGLNFKISFSFSSFFSYMFFFVYSPSSLCYIFIFYFSPKLHHLSLLLHLLRSFGPLSSASLALNNIMSKCNQILLYAMQRCFFVWHIYNYFFNKNFIIFFLNFFIT